MPTRALMQALQRGAPHDFALYGSTRPYQLAFDGEFQRYVPMLPGNDAAHRAAPNDSPPPRCAVIAAPAI